MSGFDEKLHLKGAAEEDIYFARQDHELIEALRKKKLAKLAACRGEKSQANAFEKRFKSITEKNKRKPRSLVCAIRALLDEIKAVCERRH